MDGNSRNHTSNRNSKPLHNVKKGYKNYQDFIGGHYMDKNDSRDVTNTRITGGKFSIPDSEYPTFLGMYYNDIVAKRHDEYLTEKQRESDGPIAIDLDFRYDYAVTERQHTNEDIHALVLMYLEELDNMYQFNSDNEFPVFVQEKSSVNRIKDKNITKDGVHLIIGIQADRVVQVLLRERVMMRAKELFAHLPLINTIDDVFDKGISEGYTNWQLYGSKKPDHAAYALTGMYKFEYDDSDGEFIESVIHPKKFDWANDFPKLSVRYLDHPSFFMKSDFIGEHDRLAANGPKRNKMRRVASNSVIELKTLDDIKAALEAYKESIKAVEYEKREAIECVMTLTIDYYGEGSYSKWMRVGWALANMDKEHMFIVWLAFSAQSPTFKMDTVDDLRTMWLGFDTNNEDGLTKRSVMYWARESSPEEFKRIQNNSIDYHLDLSVKNISMYNLNKNSLNGCGDTDIANILYMMFKHDYACAGIKSDKWYRFTNHRWMEDESGTTLRKHISGALRDLYRFKCDDISQRLCDVGQQEDKLKQWESLSNKLLDIVSKLGSTTHKDHILKEAREMFYDADVKFLDLLDSNPQLMCFKNGVVDFKERSFRPGRAEDYLEKSTNICYKPLDRKRDAVVIAELNDFMEKLFPLEKLRNYMWEHFASLLIGVNLNQKLHMYIGGGENGKSVLTDLLSQSLGDYYAICPLSLITQPRQKQGQASPDIVSLKGLRMAVMQEPSKDDKINDGAMKELTSGVEPIKGRNLFSTPITFIPQCKIVVCSNNFMKVNSQDHGTWRRIAVADFMSRFTDNPEDNDEDILYQFKKDPTLKEKFPQWREVFMAMLVEIAFVNQGKVSPCDLVDDASNSYRQREDHIAEFISEKIAKSDGGKITKTELANEFKLWYESTYGRGGPNVKEVQEYVNKKFNIKVRDGVWSGIRIKYNESADSGGDSDSGEEVEE